MSCYNVLGTFKFLKGLLGEEVEESVWIRCINRFFDQYKEVSFKELMSRYGIIIWNGFWDKTEHQIFYTLWLCHRLQYSDIEDMYKLTLEDFKKHGGYTLAQKYNSSVHIFVRSMYPWYEWLPWKFTKAIVNYWKSVENQRTYMKWLYDRLGFKSIEDWYTIVGDTVIKNDGMGLIRIYNSSVTRLLCVIYPEYKWLPWKFKMVPTGYWKKQSNRLDYLNWLYKFLGFKSMEDWYTVTEQHFRDNYGDGLLKSNYNSKLKDVLKDNYPEYEWLPWKFKLVPHGFWDNIKNQKWYMSWLYKELKYKSVEDWYKISIEDFKNNYGRTLIQVKYNSSPFNVLSSLIEYNWIGWKMSQAPSGFWDKIENRQKYMIWLTKLLSYKSYNDWYKLSIRLFFQNKGCGLLDKYSNSIYNLLIDTYPDVKWIKNKFNETLYSKISIEWLSDIERERGITIQHAQNVGEFKIPNSRYRADGYHKESNTIFEYNGCHTHGCISCFPKRDKVCSVTKRTYQQNYDQTKLKREFILGQGYTLEEIWDCKYKKMCKP